MKSKLEVEELLAKLQQQAEKIESLEKRLIDFEGMTFSENQKITELESRLKEAESVINKFIYKSNGLSFFVRETYSLSELNRKGLSELADKILNLYNFQCEVEGQYMEKKNGI